MTRKSLVALGIGVAAALGVTGTALATAGRDAAPDVAAASGADQATLGAAEPTSTESRSGGAEISADRAVEIALNRTGGGRVDEVEREWEHGRPVWEVEIVRDGVEYELKIDRTNGDVVKAEQESADDDRDDDRDDRYDDRGHRNDDRDHRDDDRDDD